MQAPGTISARAAQLSWTEEVPPELRARAAAGAAGRPAYAG